MMKKRMISAVLCMVMSGVLLCGCGGASEKKTAEKVGEVSTSESVQEESKAEDKAETSVEEAETPTDQTEFHVGETYVGDALKITYVRSGEYVSDNEFYQPADGNKVIFIEVYAENIGDNDAYISEYEFNGYADGYAADTFFPEDNSFSATLSPGRTVNGRVYYEVPQDASDITVEYEVDLFDEKKITFIYEGEKDSGFVPENTAEASEEAFMPGDIVESDNLKITYLSCDVYNSDNEYIQPGEGNQFISCEFEFENKSDSDQIISSFDFDCYADGSNCNASYVRDDDISATLSSGKKTKGTVTFEVPVDALNVEVEYVSDFWTSSRVVFTCPRG